MNEIIKKFEELLEQIWEATDKELVKKWYSDFLRQSIKEALESVVPIKMDYLKWQLRTDLTHDKETTIEEATQKAKGFNSCRQEIINRIKKFLE